MIASFMNGLTDRSEGMEKERTPEQGHWIPFWFHVIRLPFHPHFKDACEGNDRLIRMVAASLRNALIMTIDSAIDISARFTAFRRSVHTKATRGNQQNISRSRHSVGWQGSVGVGDALFHLFSIRGDFRRRWRHYFQ